MDSDSGRRSRKRRILDGIHLLISHHEPPFMNRCWHLTIRGHTLHVCARCSALLVGVLLAMATQFRFLYIPVTPITFFGAFLLSLPAVVDWSTQTLSLRESRNRVRALTGGLLGFAVGYILTSGNLLYYLIVVLLYSGYTLGFGVVAGRIVARRRTRESQASPVSSGATLDMTPLRLHSRT